MSPYSGWKPAIDRLHADELTFELEFRGLKAGTTDEMRKSLRSALRLEKAGEFVNVVTCPPKTALEYLTGLCEKIKTILTTFDGSITGSGFERASALVCQGARISPLVSLEKEDALVKVRNQVVVSLHDLRASFETAIRRADRKTREQSLVGLAGLSRIDDGMAVAQGESETLGSALSSGEDDDDLVPGSFLAASSPLRPADTSRVAQFKSVPVCKWNVKFSGEHDVSLGSFLERVEELRVARNVSYQELFASGVDLFEGRALIWYRANRRRAMDWPSLVQLLRDEFQTPLHDQRLLDEIRNRTQGPKETVGTYLASIETMFNRLTVRIPESRQLPLILRNLSPYYQDKLSLIDITTKDELLKYGRRIEMKREQIESYVPPPSRRNKLVEPDLACLDVESTCSEVSVEDKAKTNSGARRSVLCFNCGKKGHIRANCPTGARSFSCFGCGAPGVRRADCPRCKVKSSRSGNGTATR